MKLFDHVIGTAAVLLLVFSLTACESSSPDTYKTQAAEPAPVEETTQSSEKTPLPVEGKEPTVYMQDTPNSMCFSAVGYDSTSKMLYVEFRDSGSVYSYESVPQSVYDDLMSAQSMGGFYNSDIKGAYTCHRLS